MNVADLRKWKPKSKRLAKPRVSSEPLEQAFVDVTKATPIEPMFIIKELLPAGMLILQGMPKEVFKSTLTIIVACLTARWQCHSLPPWAECLLWGPTMIWPLEAEPGEINWTIRTALEVEPEDNTIWAALKPWEYKLDADDRCEKMLAWLRMYRPRLVILDPFRNMWSGDENDSGAIIGALQPMQAWAKANDACVIIVHHTVKPTEGRNMSGIHAGRGSGALPGLADGILTLEPGNQQGRIWVNAVFKRGRPYRRLIQLGAPGFGWPMRGSEVLSDNAKRIRNALNDGGDLATVATDLGINGIEALEAVEMLRRNNLLRDQ